jgi:N-acetylglucosamine-6-sulfatase
VSDKPPWIQLLGPLPDRALARTRASQRSRLRELLALDDTIGAIVDSLRSRGALADTVIMFASDNGVFLGEHRIPPFSKNMPYEPAVLVPCVVRGPGFPHTTIRQSVQMSIDLTATCVELAGATPDLALDGESLTRVVADPAAYDDRHLLYDRDNRDNYTFPTDAAAIPPPADGVFTKDWKLIRYQTSPPTYELYNLAADPGELHNVADDPASSSDRVELEQALDQLLAR